MKESDLILITQLIYTAGPASRAGLAEKTKLAPSYISTLVRHLQERGLVLEGGHAPSKGGRRRVLLYVNPDLAHLIGIDVGTAFTRIVITDFLGRVMTSKRLPTELWRGKDRVLENVDAEVQSALQSDSAIKGIGIAVSGVIDREAGTILFWPKVSGWEDAPLKRIFESRYGFPATLEDSVRTMALTEQRFGQGKGLSDFVYVSVGMGIGSAVFINSQLYFGHGGLAGELGHTTIDETGELCSCGNRGCLEVYASGWAVINRVRAGLQHGVSSSLQDLVKEHPDRLSVEAIVSAAKSRDRLSRRVLTEAGSHLGTGLASIVNLLNPERIILGGMVPRAAKGFIFTPLFLSLNERAFHRSVRDLKVVVSKLGDDAGAIGAALMIGEQILASLPPRLMAEGNNSKDGAAIPAAVPVVEKSAGSPKERSSGTKISGLSFTQGGGPEGLPSA